MAEPWDNTQIMFREESTIFHSVPTFLMPELFITKAMEKKMAAERAGLGARLAHLERIVCTSLAEGRMNNAERTVLISTQV